MATDAIRQPGVAATSVDAAPLVVPVDGAVGRQGLVGGKGEWLGRLVEAGFTVPESVVITTEAYRRVASIPAIAALVDDLAHSDPGAGQGDAERARVDHAFLEVPLPGSLTDAIAAAARRVAGPTGRPMAIRSSATAEDLHGTSFAGQYRSFLGVDPAGFERAVRLVWASLWHPAPRAYRRFHGIADDDIAMGVVAMAMVDADLSGVGFSTDPEGTADLVRVEVVHGLGEQLVSGAVTPEVHRLARIDPTPSTDPQVRQVADLVLAIERAFGEPQDIEWAFEGDRLFVLQARPITSARPVSGDGFDSDTAATTGWTTAGIAEMVPGVVAPLVWETNRRLLESAFRELFDQMATLPVDVDQRGSFVARFRGRAALNLDLLREVSGGDERSDREIERQYFGGTDGPAVRRSWRERVAAWRHARRMERVRQRATVGAAVVDRAVAELSVAAPELGAMGIDALRAYRFRLLDLGGRAMTSEVAVASAASAAFRRLELSLGKRIGAEEGTRRALELVGGAGGHGERVPDPASSRAVFAGPTWREREAGPELPAGKGPAPTAGPARPGERADRQHVAEPGERVPAPVGGRPSLEQSWSDVVGAIEALPGWTSTRVLTGQVVDIRVLVLRQLVEDAASLLEAREAAKRTLLRLGGEVRVVHLEIGRRFADDGRLDEPGDIDLLGEREVAGSVPLPPLAEVARRRRALDREQALEALPLRFAGRPERRRAVTVGGDVLHGWGASGGRHRGRPVVLDDPDDEGLQRGDVLVARTTDASWAPVFMRAGALVIEEGGPLSHAAIIARELGLPAVVNVPGVVDRLRQARDQMVTVDGDDGVVVVGSGSGSEP